MIGHWLTSDRGLAGVLVAFAVLIAALAVVVALALTQSTQAITDIQASRHDLCVDQNHHHDRTVRELDSRIAKLPPAQHRRALASRAFTVALIDSLAPKRDCARLAPK